MKYKHKQTGKIAQLEFDIRYYLIEGECHIPSYLVEKSNDWEKLEEKDYEIIDWFIGKTDRITTSPDWSASCYNIHSVKRLSDNEIFKIGDRVYNPKCPTQKFTIEKFYLDCNDVHMLVEPEHININKIEHYKEPILITEDGISLFTNDLVWFITDNMYEVYYKHCNKDMSTKYKYFSTKAIAEKYIENNKPKFSKKELMDIIQLDTEQYDDGEVIEKLVKLIENK